MTTPGTLKKGRSEAKPAVKIDPRMQGAFFMDPFLVMPPRSWRSRLFWSFTHQSQLISVGVSEFSQPQLGRRSTVHNMRARPELDAPFHQGVEDRVNIGHLEVDG